MDPAGSETISWVSITVQGEWRCTSGLGTSAGLLRQIYTDHKTNHDLLWDVSVFLTLQMRRAKSKRYVLVHSDGVEVIFVGIGLICVPTAVVIYGRINRNRDVIQRAALENGEQNKYADQVVRELGDLSPDFRYTI